MLGVLALMAEAQKKTMVLMVLPGGATLMGPFCWGGLPGRAGDRGIRFHTFFRRSVALSSNGFAALRHCGMSTLKIVVLRAPTWFCSNHAALLRLVMFANLVAPAGRDRLEHPRRDNPAKLGPRTAIQWTAHPVPTLTQR